MSEWITLKPLVQVYKVNIEELDLDKAKKFANQMLNNKSENQYNRYSFDQQKRIEKIINGKLSEQAFALFLKKEIGIDILVDYNIYEGIYKADENDCLLNGFEIDIKSSVFSAKKDNDIYEQYNYLNFPVPTNQKIKDLTVGVLYDTAKENFYIVSWIDKDTYQKNCKICKFNGEGKNIEFYKYPYRNGFSLKDIDLILKKEQYISLYSEILSKSKQ